MNETPRSFSPQPFVSLSGSDHNKSHSKPVSGTSVGLMIRRICSIDCKSGERPEWYKIMEPVLTNVLYKRHLHTTDSKFKCRIYQIDVSTDMQHDMKRAQ